MNNPQINNQNEPQLTSAEYEHTNTARRLGRMVVGVTLGIIGAKTTFEVLQALLEYPPDTFFWNVVMPTTVGSAAGLSSTALHED